MLLETRGVRVSLRFPDGFTWGVSTSSYQIEGGNEAADWHAWERAGKVDPAGRACDSWNRFERDVDLVVELGLSAYRISLEWSRIEPEPGRFEEAAIARYADWLAYARSRGLRTMLVLWHFTNPVWLTEKGAWLSPEAPVHFEAFVRKVVPVLAPHVDDWATLNEANTYANHGWITGEWPPGRRLDYPGGFRAYDGLAEGHRRARAAIKELLGEATPVGLTHVLSWAHPAGRWGALSVPCMRFWEWLGITRFLDRVAGDIDWLGVQYYHDAPCRPIGMDLDDGNPPRTDMGWRICPEGIYHAVMFAHRRYGVPLLLTENGLADAEDAQRGRFLLDHLAWLRRALDEGADLRGYYHWSLLDNYEWAYGYEPRFGLVAVDYDTCERAIRPSGRLYAEIASANALPEGLRPDLRYADGTPSLAPR
ncbi:MAG: glycoside hydrolase family 1 protein [Actinobacteria bacterium]|nr:MAG: glycoside hydrolase family 1 protein [Actinomycetota bacterium]